MQTSLIMQEMFKTADDSIFEGGEPRDARYIFVVIISIESRAVVFIVFFRSGWEPTKAYSVNSIHLDRPTPAKGSTRASCLHEEANCSRSMLSWQMWPQ